MNLLSVFSRGLSSRALAGVLTLAAVAMVPALRAQNPVGKLYVAGTSSGAGVMTSGKIVPLSVKDVFPAEGAQVDTKASGDVTMVFSNGTGVFLDHATRMVVKRFTQEPFQASRTDLESEPSASHTEIAIPFGTVAISTSKLAHGSTLVIATPLGSFELKGGNLVIEVGPTSVKFFLLAGDGTARIAKVGGNGQELHAGEQAVILPGVGGQPSVVQVGPIPAGQLPPREALVERAYNARRTVFFKSDDNDLVPVTVVPQSLPVQASISPSKLPN